MSSPFWNCTLLRAIPTSPIRRSDMPYQAIVAECGLVGVIRIDIEASNGRIEPGTSGLVNIRLHLPLAIERHHFFSIRAGDASLYQSFATGRIVGLFS